MRLCALRRDAGVDQVKVLAGAALPGANRFYPACGFHKVAELTQHCESLNVYVYDVREFAQPIGELR